MPVRDRKSALSPRLMVRAMPRGSGSLPPQWAECTRKRQKFHRKIIGLLFFVIFLFCFVLTAGREGAYKALIERGAAALLALVPLASVFWTDGF
ncbi:hypothetical protein, partial [Rhizobium rhizosphaerae]|uniref:hypothetical protein n=1 Tax=Xaviernesmea rhizosphaerae TaxID=1672749 RepID=UPI001AECE390